MTSNITHIKLYFSQNINTKKYKKMEAIIRNFVSKYNPHNIPTISAIVISNIDNI